MTLFNDRRDNIGSGDFNNPSGTYELALPVADALHGCCCVRAGSARCQIRGTACRLLFLVRRQAVCELLIDLDRPPGPFVAEQRPNGPAAGAAEQA